MTLRVVTLAIALLATGASWSVALAAGDAWLPVGDGRIATEPRNGYVFVCSMRRGMGGADRAGAWIRGDKWNPDLKPVVDGRVVWPNARIEIALDGAERVVSANNLPTHPTGTYPVSPSDDAYRYDRNPNRIRERDILVRLPANPKVAARPSCVPMGMIGFAVTGVAIYNALDGPLRDAVAHEIQDACSGHPERSGQYHYHGPSPCMPDTAEPVGYAMDGFGIYGIYDEDGRELRNADLDECHGHEAPVLWNGRRQRIYHYHLTREYPYTVGCFKGTPVALAGAGGGPPQFGAPQFGAPQFGAPPGGMPRRGGDPLAGAAAELGVDLDTLRRAVGPPPPDIDRASRILGIDRERLREVMERHRP